MLLAPSSPGSSLSPCLKMRSHLDETKNHIPRGFLYKVKASTPYCLPCLQAFAGYHPYPGEKIHLCCPTANLEHVVQRQVAEALPGESEGTCGLLYFMGPVPWGLGIPHQGQLHVLPHFVKLLLCLFELAYIPRCQPIRVPRIRGQNESECTVNFRYPGTPIGS